MIAVELRNRAGGVVATIEVPETPSQPSIVKWGASYYSLRRWEGSGPPIYDEKWCYAVPVGDTVST